ncbi:MAG: hypothetical protein WA446_00395 [Steroidobacteraceae bacterium]
MNARLNLCRTQPQGGGVVRYMLTWRKSIEVLDKGQKAPRTLALFPDDRYEAAVDDESVVRLKLSRLRLERPRQWGGCWLALQLWPQLELDDKTTASYLPDLIVDRMKMKHDRFRRFTLRSSGAVSSRTSNR